MFTHEGKCQEEGCEKKAIITYIESGACVGSYCYEHTPPSLEERVAALEEENKRLKQRLGLEAE